MNRQLEELNAWIYAGDAGRDDDPPNNDDEPGDPVGAELEKSEAIRRGVPAVFLDAGAGSDAAFAKRFDNLAQPQLFGMAAALRQAGHSEELHKRAGGGERIEILKLDGGDFWKNTYRNGELVGMELHYANGDIERFDGDGNEVAA